MESNKNKEHIIQEQDLTIRALTAELKAMQLRMAETETAAQLWRRLAEIRKQRNDEYERTASEQQSRIVAIDTSNDCQSDRRG